MLGKIFYKAVFLLSTFLGLQARLLEQLSKRISVFASYHHYFHYYCSAIFTYIGHIHLMNGKNEDALVNYNNAIFQDHDNKFALLGKEIIEKSKMVSSGLFGSTLGYLDKLVTRFDYADINYSNQNTSLDLGFSHIKAKEFKLATECFSQYSHKNSRLFLGVGLASFYQEDLSNSLKNLEKARDLAINEHDVYHKKFSHKYYQRAIFYFFNKDYDLSGMDLTKSLELCSGNIDALLLRGQIYLEKQNYPSAISDYNKILELSPRNKVAKNNLKEIYKVMA
jgi:tetratricopeptide (TPR) repeat protein